MNVKKFWKQVDKESSTMGCWLWNGQIEGDTGYAYTDLAPAISNKAFRVAYYLKNGTRPLVMRHTCHNTRCVNPNHIEVVN